MATRIIRTRLELAGDREFRDKLKQANAGLAGYDCTVLRVDDTTGAKDISMALIG